VDGVFEDLALTAWHRSMLGVPTHSGL
jgi:hypothetical protein